jgi:hypothetical protein
MTCRAIVLRDVGQRRSTEILLVTNWLDGVGARAGTD